jgi:hypothetical protein
MVFNSNTLFIFVISLLFVWCIILTVLYNKIARHYQKLAKFGAHKGLKEVLDQLISIQESHQSKISVLEEKYQNLYTETRTHIQRIGIVRFNPFSDTGGSQSFTLALLDGHNNGLIVTSLYGRTGNRWYLKEIVRGKGLDIELSKEESEAIEKATNIKQNEKN